MNVRKVVGLGGMLLIAAMFAACGGGSVSVPGPAPTATPTPVPIPSASPFSVTQQQLGIPIATAPPSGPTPSPVPIPLASANGVAVMLVMPPANSAGTESITATVQNTAPTSVPVLDLKRAAQALRRTQQTIPAVAVVYLGLFWGSPITFLATPGFSIVVPAADIVPNTSYYLALYDPTRPSLGWQYGFEGPAAVSGTTLNFVGSTSAFSFASDVQYWLAVIALPQSVAPTPAPSVAPTTVPTSSPPPPQSPGATMTMTFDDEFNGAAGAPVNTTNWTDDTGPWSQNQELEDYANVTSPSGTNYAPQYAEQDGNGHLVITANSGNPFAATCSARLTTRGIFSQTYGYFEARIQIPPGQGLWPAFWLTDGTGTTSGEIDAMETIGSAPATVFGALHGPGFNTTGPLTVEYTEPSGVALSSGFHIYGVLWNASSIKYYLDNALYATVTPSTIPAGGTWVFNQPFYLVLNLAVGGDFPGSPNSSTPFPATMIVDYVHGYK
jgi:beta-glucanase (GH16 family)